MSDPGTLRGFIGFTKAPWDFLPLAEEDEDEDEGVDVEEDDENEAFLT